MKGESPTKVLHFCFPHFHLDIYYYYTLYYCCVSLVVVEINSIKFN